MKVIYPENHPAHAPKEGKVKNSLFPEGDPRRYELRENTFLENIAAGTIFYGIVVVPVLIAIAAIVGIAFAIAMFVKLVMFFI